MILHTIWARVLVQDRKKHIPYFISIDGQIISTDYIDTLGRKRHGRSYKSKRDYKGYHRIALNKQTYITPSLQRNIALVFIPNPRNKPEVNHKDGNKDNNTIENLEWMTTAENVQHAINLGLREAFIKDNQIKGTKATIRKYSKIPSSRNSK